MSTAAFALNTR